MRQEAAALRSECNRLLRQRFELEQCLRYLAAAAGLPCAVRADATGTARRGPAGMLRPGSLAPVHVGGGGDGGGGGGGSDGGGREVGASAEAAAGEVEAAILRRVEAVCAGPRQS